MKIRENNVMYLRNGKEIKALTVKGLSKKLFSDKKYITFKNSKKKIAISEINKSLFFSLKGAELAC